MSYPKIDYDKIKQAALNNAATFIPRWLPDGGQKKGSDEWVSKNPKRVDNVGNSFSVNMRTGQWADFGHSAKGHDLISLAAYLHGQQQWDAAKSLADALGISPYV